MSLTRKMLKAMGIDEEKVDQIIEAHTETVDALKAERDVYKTDSEKLAGVQKELDERSKETPFEVKYNALKEEYDTYKNGIETEKQRETKTKAYKELLKACNIDEKRFDSILKVTPLESIEIDNEGKIKAFDTLKESVAKDWGDFIVTEKTSGAAAPTPPAKTPTVFTKDAIAKMSADEINQNWDAIKNSLKN